MKLEGIILEIRDTKEVGAKAFRVRDMILQTAEQYPQEILIQFVQDKTEFLGGFNVGQRVEVSINIRGRAWENPSGEIKHFNTIQGWNITVLDMTLQDAKPIQGLEPNDDMPF